MEGKFTIRQIQEKILDVMKYIDKLCRENDITYFIMGGTAIGAVRHGGFIPWDDDLDIFMTPNQYMSFKKAFNAEKNKKYVLQEWKTNQEYLEYAKVRMNGTTFIEEAFKDRSDLHQGIYVDIMILHKVPKNKFIQRIVYMESKFVTLYALSKRNWKPKTKAQSLALRIIKFLPCRAMNSIAYKRIFQYDSLTDCYCYCYWITTARFKNGIFDASFFEKAIDIRFEDTMLLGSEKIKEYLECRYGDYMKLPSKENQKAAAHVMIFDANKDYKEYFKEGL